MKLGAAGRAPIHFLLALGIGACAATPTAAQQEKVAAYGVELSGCIATAKLLDAGREDQRAASCACRERVERAYDRLGDGGSLDCGAR